MKKIAVQLCLILCGILTAYSQEITADTVAPEKTITNQAAILKLVTRFGAPFMPERNVMFSLSGALSANSNSVPSAFSNTFLFPKFIDEGLKQEAFSKLKPMNRFGAEYSTEGAVSFHPDSTWKAGGQFIRISFAQKQLYALGFSEDLFRVVFGGNAAYADRRANFDNSSFYGISYQTLKAGFFKNVNKITLGVSLGIARGLSHTNLRVKSGNLYTDAAGEYLDVAFNGSYLESGIVSNQLHVTPSYGGLMDLLFVVRPGKNWNLFAEVKDFGFINWNESTSLLSRDTAFRFTGVQVNDLFDFGDSSIVFGDTLLKKIKGDEVTGVSMRALPATFRLSATKIINNWWRAGVSAQYRNIPSYTMQYELSLKRVLMSGMAFGINCYYGGFGKFNTGLEATLLNNGRHYLMLGTMFNEGLISAKKAAGSGFMLRYSYNL